MKNAQVHYHDSFMTLPAAAGAVSC